MKNQILNILEKHKIKTYNYMEKDQTFEPIFTNATMISDTVALTEILKQLDIKYIVGERFEIRIIH